MLIKDLLNYDVCDYASYDNVRKIPGIDGLKNAQRKVVFTVLEKNIKEPLKVLQLANKSAEFAEYLHGDLSGVVINMSANFTGANNVELLTPKGNFGTRLMPAASAPRYIFAKASENLLKLFNPDDMNILTEQEFEGQRIEPKFYVPSIPVSLLNGAEGVSTGFACSILPRSKNDLKKSILKIIQNKKIQDKDIMPYYRGFTGTFEIDPDTDGKVRFICKGIAKRIDKTSVQITETPIGFDYKSYVKVLDSLEEKKIINSYQDLCDTKEDKFNFIVKMPSKILDTLTEEEVLLKLKLIQKMSENITILDENNKIKEFESISEYLKYFVNFKLGYIQKRKNYILEKYSEEVNFLKNKYRFIQDVIDNNIIIAKRKKEEIIKDLVSLSYDRFNENFDYLLNMPIFSLTNEKMNDLKNQIKSIQSKSKEIKCKTLEQIYQEDLNCL